MFQTEIGADICALLKSYKAQPTLSSAHCFSRLFPFGRRSLLLLLPPLPSSSREVCNSLSFSAFRCLSTVLVAQLSLPFCAENLKRWPALSNLPTSHLFGSKRSGDPPSARLFRRQQHGELAEGLHRQPSDGRRDCTSRRPLLRPFDGE